MTLPELTFCIWNGDLDEHFTFMDMNRIEYNANIIAREAGVTQVQFVEADRTQQFRYDEMEKVEDLASAIALQVGIVAEEPMTWYPGRSLTYADFERIEWNLYRCYQALGGIGDRIEAGRFKRVVSATLFSDGWVGTPPHIDLDVPMVHDGAEVLAYVPHYATLEERMAEMAARLVASSPSERILRITATGAIPKISIPIRIALGGFSTIENKTLSTAWQGNGPWTQTVELAETPENVLVGMSELMNSEESKAYAKAGIYASDVSGKNVTLTALFEKPTRAIPIGILYSTASVV